MFEMSVEKHNALANTVSASSLVKHTLSAPTVTICKLLSNISDVLINFTSNEGASDHDACAEICVACFVQCSSNFRHIQRLRIMF